LWDNFSFLAANLAVRQEFLMAQLVQPWFFFSPFRVGKAEVSSGGEV